MDSEEVMVWVVASDTRALPKLVGLWATVRDEIGLEAEIEFCFEGKAGQKLSLGWQSFHQEAYLASLILR